MEHTLTTNNIKRLQYTKDDLLGYTQSNQSTPYFLVFAGPSGSGKGTIISRFVREYGESIQYSISHTSRDPRTGESDGVHYYFVTKELMLSAIEDGLFLEHTKIFGNVYGTSLAEVARIRSSGKICILEIDIEGVKQIKQSVLSNECYYVFIDTPNNETLESRLRGRGTETNNNIQSRLQRAIEERSIAKQLQFDLYLENDNLDDTVNKLKDCALIWYPFLSN